MQKSTVISLLALVVLGLVVLTQQGGPQEKGIVRFSLAEANISTATSIEIAGEKAIVLEKSNGLWMVDKGIRANQKAVESVLDSLAKINTTNFITAKESRHEEFGLTEKGALVTIKAAGKNLASLTLGKSEAGKTYLLAENGVFSLKGLNKGTFEKARSAWLDLAIVQEKAAEAEKLEIALNGEPAFVLVKDEDAWSLAEGTQVPDGYRFDASAAQQLVSSLSRLRAKDVLAKRPEEKVSGLGESASLLTLEFKSEAGEAKEIGLAFGLKNDAGDVYGQVRGEERVFLLAQSTAKRALKSIVDLRDLKLLAAEAKTITQLELRHGKTRNLFVKKDGTWVIERSTEKTSESFEFDPAVVERRLGAVLRFKADSHVSGVSAAQAGLLKSGKSISLSTEDGQSIILRFGKTLSKDGKDDVYVSGNIDNLVYRVSQTATSRLFGGLESFKKIAPPPSMGGGLANIDPAQLANLPPDVRSSILQQIQAEKKKQEMMQRIQAQAAKKKATN